MKNYKSLFKVHGFLVFNFSCDKSIFKYYEYYIMVFRGPVATLADTSKIENIIQLMPSSPFWVVHKTKDLKLKIRTL